MLKRTMIQLYIEKCDEAIKFYQEAFNGKMRCDHRNDDGSVAHAEMEVFGQIIAFSQRNWNENKSKAVQLCFHFEKGQIDIGRRAYDTLRNDAFEIYSDFSTADTGYWDEWQFEIVDKYGIFWCLFC
ncbi:MAG: hypothetical protein FWC95_07895 [Defluviitaleaceae bacterium]|nr:hypothetical protein [Defluviitaleaceae bacterium]